MITLDIDAVAAHLHQRYDPELVTRLKATRVWGTCIQCSMVELITEVDMLETSEEAQERRQTRLQAFKQERWGNAIDDLFVKYRAQFDQVCYTLLRLRDPGVAQELYFRILEGESSMELLAQRYSEVPDRWTGGRMGPHPITQATPVLARKLLSSPIGEVQAPFHIAPWHLILRVDARQNATLDPSLHPALIDQAFAEWSQEIQKEVYALS